MKTRKILPLLALAVIALFVLAGCDAMLESIYPNETNPQNSLTVSVYAYYPDVYVDMEHGAPLTILIQKDGDDYTTLTTPLQYGGSDYIEFYYTFTDLKNGTYTAYAWMDWDGDGTPAGDYSFGEKWPAVQSDNVTHYVDLSSGSSGYLSDNVYYYGWEYKSF